MKFNPTTVRTPVLMIMGQSAVANRAAMPHLLKHDCRRLVREIESLDRFRLMLRVDAADTYGHQALEAATDLSAVAS
ncbi:hypothetical protein ABT247_18855 [Kitasatospora sp. NPDC001539]|uniref:hypothetical protein n=1 Tax=Kitasatospora sp. NPDC001539 TaxID=3154384 RepID=UPI00331E8570